MRITAESELSDQMTSEDMCTQVAVLRSPSESDLIDRVIDWIKQNQRAPDSGAQITADTELVTAGLLDSLGLVELIHFIETQVGCRIDLIDVDPEEFTIVKGLCRIGLRCQNRSMDAVRQ